MKTEFNVERVCERVQLCVVDAPDELGQPKIEVRGGSIYISFPDRVPFVPEVVTAVSEAIEPVAKLVPGEIKPMPAPKRKGR